MEITRARAGWRYVHFAVRQIAPGKAWAHDTGADECCLVLLAGQCQVSYRVKGSDPERKVPRGLHPTTQSPRGGGPGLTPAHGATSTVTLGPRRNVFADYPHALYLPARTSFRVDADIQTELADGRAPSRRRMDPRQIRPEDCGFEIRGGGNATRQIVDVMPPAFPADRLLVCEVFTPSGNWSSYPPHKHDQDRPPAEVKLEEIYYYRFEHPDAYGFQRLYDRRTDRTVTVRHGDVVTVRSGYHPFVTAYGYNGYYLNVLAGTRRSMAASDDPRYAAFRAWPPPDPRLPLVARPGSGSTGSTGLTGLKIP